jgi:hypothetical protein
MDHQQKKTVVPACFNRHDFFLMDLLIFVASRKKGPEKTVLSVSDFFHSPIARISENDMLCGL